MKRNSKYSLQLALSACLAVTAGNALAAEESAEAPDTSNWACKFCVVPYGWFGDLQFGALWVDDPTPKFADYRGLDDDGFYADLNGAGGWRGEGGYYFDYYARNVALDSRIVRVEGGKQGTYDLRAGYQEIPRYLGNGTVTPYSGEGKDVLTLPSDWSPVSGGTMNVAKLETNRTVMDAGLTVRALSNWRFDADVERQEKDGSKTSGGTLFYVNAGLFPSPLKYTTDRFLTSVEYDNSWLQLRADYQASDFSNSYTSVTWDNPFTIGLGDELSRTGLMPDNEYQQFSLSGAVRITDWLRFNGKLSSGEAEQNDSFLPYSINPEYEDRPLPRESLNGKLETSMYNIAGRLSARLSKGLDLTASYKSSERDNKTPSDSYEPVMFEIYPRPARSNRIYSYDRSLSKVSLRWRARYNLRFLGGYLYEERDRTYQEVAHTEEDTWFGEVQWAPIAMLDLRLKYDSYERTASPSVQQGNYDRPENPLMRKYNMANRDGDRTTVEVNLMPIDNMSVAFSYYSTDDSYSKSVVGLTDAEETSMSIDFNYGFSNGTSVYAFFTDEEYEARMSGANGAGATPWDGQTRDEITSWGVGVSGKLGDKWSYGFDWVSSDSDGNILTTLDGAGEPFPTLTTELDNIRLHVDYDLNERWALTLEAYNEQYDTKDWTVDGVGPLTVDGLLTMGQESPDYDVNVIRVLATWRL